MKKVLSLILIVALIFTVVACAKTTPAPAPTPEQPATPAAPVEESFKIGVVIPSGDHGFTGESVAHAKMEAEALMKKYKGLEIVVKDGLEASHQITSIENLLAGGDVDLIMLWPMEGEALRSAAQSIIDAKVKLVIYDRLISNFSGLVGEIMGDNVGIGKMMGEYINKYYSDMESVQYLRFVGDSSTVTGQRSEGMDGLIDKKFQQVANTFVTNWSTETAQGQMENWLNAKSVKEIEDLDLIVTHDDEIVDGLMNALEAYTGPAKINVKLITSVGGREGTMVKFENTKLPTKFCTFYFAPAFIREALRLSVADLYGEAYKGANLTNGQYLIPSFSISNSGNSTYDFNAYRKSDIYVERYSIGNF
ncbi:MAG: periplasmic binding protein/LacI transcriptional regulator [Clostridia bacterium]|jgi:ribose transport system substrate-binding protein|nr:periplasmic binding protein/LacI transcriptional regulator [Clostridia bacterium]